MAGREYEVGGTVYEFPDSFDDAKVKDILTKKGVIKVPVPKEGAFKRFSKALGEGNPMSMQHGTPEEMAARVGRPLTEQLSELNPINMVRGLLQPVDELARGQTAEAAGHFIGGMGAGATKPAGFRSPITVGAPIIPRPGGIVSRVVPGARQAGNIASEVSRLRLRSPVKPWEPPTTPTTPASPRFKSAPPAASAPKPAPSPTPPLPPSRGATPNPANLREWLRGGERPTPPIESAPATTATKAAPGKGTGTKYGGSENPYSSPSYRTTPRKVTRVNPTETEAAIKESAAKPTKPTKEASLEDKLYESVKQQQAKNKFRDIGAHKANVTKMANFLKSSGIDPEMANGAKAAQKIDLLKQAGIKKFSDLDSAWNEVIDEMQGRSSPAKGPTPDLPPTRFKP